jgi:hypothetical protein
MSSRAQKNSDTRCRFSRRLQTTAADAKVATIDGNNHMLPLRSPNALEQLTADFVRRHPNA